MLQYRNMERKWIVVFCLILLGVLVALAAVFLFGRKEIRTSPVSFLEECKTLQYNGPDKINLVFFSDKELAEQYADFFFEILPFNKSRDSFNVFYLTDYQPECEIYKDVALLCYSRELVKKASSCSADYIVVPKKRESSLRSSQMMNVMSINTEHPLAVFPHEFGHAFANLAEEYVPAKLSRKAKNCVSSCSQFGDRKDGCFKGCSKGDYVRSIERGIMRTFSSRKYGVFNEDLLAERIRTELSKVKEKVLQCRNQEYYLIEAMYDSKKERIEIIGKSKEKGCAGGNGFGDFISLLRDTGGTILSEASFSPELIFTDSPTEDAITGQVFENTKPFLLRVPVIQGAETLEIIHNDIITELNLRNGNVRRSERKRSGADKLPIAINLQATGPISYCSDFPHVVLSWDFCDPGDTQLSYQIQVDDNPDFSSPIDSQRVSSASTSFALNRPYNLEYAKTYYWRVKVWDKNDHESAWIYPSSSNTCPVTVPLASPAGDALEILHQGPQPAFTWAPDPPSVPGKVAFLDASRCYDRNNELYDCKDGAASEYQWDFNYQQPHFMADSSNRGNTSYTYFGSRNPTVILRVTDNAGMCATEHTLLRAELPLPTAKEIPPS